MHKVQLLADDIFIIHNFLNSEECLERIAIAEEIGFGLAPINTSFGAVVRTDVRNNDRVMIDDQQLAGKLFERLTPFLPTKVGYWYPCGLNERFRYYRYTVGQRFDWHIDGSFSRDNGEMSKLTFMIYLNDECTGGHTSFNLRREGVLRADDQVLSVQPTQGMALVFRHQFLHTGEMVTSGTKYVLRSDVMCHLKQSD